MKEKPFTKLLAIDHLFPSPIWRGEAPQFVKSLNKASDPYIKKSKKNMAKQVKERNKIKTIINQKNQLFGIQLRNKGNQGKLTHFNRK